MLDSSHYATSCFSTPVIFCLCSSFFFYLFSFPFLSLPVLSACWLWRIRTLCGEAPLTEKNFAARRAAGGKKCCTDLPLAVGCGACSCRQSTLVGCAGMGRETAKEFQSVKASIFDKSSTDSCVSPRGAWGLKMSSAGRCPQRRVKQFSFMTVYLWPHYGVSHKDMTCSLGGFRAI